MKKLTRALAVATAALTLGAGLAIAPTLAAVAAPPVNCSGDALIEKTFDNGTQWEMCWRVDSKKGLTLEQVNVKAPGEEGFRRVLDSVYLGQLHVPYDTGKNVWNDITSYGFGNQYLQKLSAAECMDGALRDVAQTWTTTRRGVTTTWMRTIPALCITDTTSAMAYRSHEQTWGSIEDAPLFTAEGQSMTLQIISKVDWYEYATKVEFTDEGLIDFNLGATGDISYEDFDADATTGWPTGVGATDFAASHWHNAIWRLDFGLDGQSNMQVEQYDSEFGEMGAKARLLHTTPETIASPANLVPTTDMTWWRVVAPESINADGHARSYEFVFPGSQLYQGDPVTQPLLSVTNYNACQEYATNNLNTACADKNVLQYVASGAGQTITDPVVWVNSGFHHVVRDEDQSPMQTHWQTFSIMPRDWTSQSMSTPDGRSCINGDPGGEIHTDESPCEVSEPSNPPVDPSNPPVDPSNPPVDPSNPPVDPSNPPAETGDAALILSTKQLTAGKSFDLSGVGFAAYEKVDVTLHSDPVLLGTLVADEDGAITGSLVVPASATSGAHKVIAVGQESGAEVAVDVTVTSTAAPAGTDTGPLASTGSTVVGGVVVAGLLLLIAGGALVMRRRRRSEESLSQ